MPLTNLDLSSRVRLRRLELGLSQAELARLAGCQPSGIYHLERSGDLGNWTTRCADLLRSALGWDWNQMMETTNEPRTTDLRIEDVGAEFARSGSLDTTMLPSSVDLHRLREGLRGALLPAGLDVTETNGTWMLIPASGTTPLARQEGSTRVAAGNLRGPEREVLAAWLSGTLDEQRLPREHRRALATLTRAGLIEHSPAP